VSRPLRLVQDAAGRLGAGDLAARAPAGGPVEVQELAAGFNRMAGRLEELVAAQDQFVADASHELRTPLTALRLRLEMLDPGPDTEAALGEVARLARLVDGLLSLARADHADAAPAQRIQLAACLDERREAWEPVADELGVRLVVDADGSAVRAGPDRIAQVLDNLLANALDASPRDTTIRIEARRGVIRVADEGPGMSESDRERAFDRFWRASVTRGSLGGSGLGLAIVAKLVSCDDGTVGLEAAPGGGLVAVVRYPVG
jgi:signal transduction histidine kinase